jgi:hypothetical protein
MTGVSSGHELPEEMVMARPAHDLGSSRMVTGLFADRTSAERAYLAAVEHGYEKEDVSVVISDDARKRFFPDEGSANNDDLASRAAEGPETASGGSELGGPTGGTLATLAPALAAVGTVLLIPGIVFAGPVAVALAAAGAVGVTSGLIGALAHWGIPKERVSEYEAAVRRGGILLGVKARSAEDAGRIESQWTALGGKLVHS